MDKFELFQRVTLTRDIPEKRLRRGDVVTIVDRHPSPDGGEAGYSLEVTNAVGDTLAVIVVPESALQPLRAEELLSVREFARAA